ncbi:MAG TPA: AAA family ATPase, partial [Candidatus Eisenbacteria bacterium]|nr:AAA family ATPase [Candidatus Eisenbacteria bacterium]
MGEGSSTLRLPGQSTSFVGRSWELDRLTDLVRSSRLVTITGPAGMGKTRLAIEVAARATRLVAEVRFAGLAALTDRGLVPHELAARLGAPERAAEPVTQALAEHIGARHLLLVLDNCEHLVDDCARLVETLLRACPELRVLATSLQPLRVPGELLWRIAPLTVPGVRPGAGSDESDDSEAVRLFEARARLVHPGFTVGPANAEAVATLCRRLEGVPLAIELAAARIATMSVQEIVDRLDDRFRLLAAAGHVEVARHRSLHAALDWGWQLLDGRQRRLFSRVAVFSGGFELGTAEVVCSGAGLEPGDVGDLVFGLVERSLLQPDTNRPGPDRYTVLEALRQYGAERLRESGEQDAVAGRHAAWYLALAQRAGREERGQDQGGWLERLEAELDNLRVALDWYRRHDVSSWLAMATALSWLWVTHGRFGEGRAWLEGALAAAAPDAPERGGGLLAAARVAFWQGDYAAARRHCESSLDLLEAPDDAVDRGWALTLLGSIHGYQGEYDRAGRRFQEALAATGDDLVRMEALVGMGEMLLQAGDAGRARERLLEVVRLTRGPEAPRGRAALFLGLAALFADDHGAAQGDLLRSLDIFHRLGNRYGAAATLDALAGLAVANTDPVRALRLGGAASALRDATRSQLAPRWRELVRTVAVEPARRAAGDHADAAWAAGRAMTLDEAVHYARTGLSPRVRRGPAPRGAPAAPPGAPARLTPRELEVAELVARGMTNREIAERL